MMRERGRPPVGTSHALRLLARDPLPPLPDPADLVEREAPRRPGELHEALVLERAAADHVAEQAALAGVHVDVAASVLLEAGLLCADLGPRVSALRATRSSGAVRLPHAHARYLRSLTLCRRAS